MSHLASDVLGLNQKALNAGPLVLAGKTAAKDQQLVSTRRLNSECYTVYEDCDKDMQEIFKEEVDNSRQMFEDAVNEEKSWAKYLFQNGSMIGLSEKLLCDYVEWICNRRMKAVGLRPLYDRPASHNPLPWTDHWLKSKGVQNAPQETEIESYVMGGIKQDIKQDAFAGFKL